jgi:hypothetical protein
LTGEQNYTVTFEGAMTYAQPVPPAFWSLTMYDGITRYSVPNPINSYSLGSSNELKRNAGGSLTLYLQHNSPGADKEANWHCQTNDLGPPLVWGRFRCGFRRSRPGKTG